MQVTYHRTRTPSIGSISRRRASCHHRLLLYPLLTTLELLLLALPITIYLLVHASFSNRSFIPPLIAFILIALLTCLSAVGVGVLYVRYRRTQVKQKRKLEREVERWRMLAREKSREVEVLQAVSERLRSRSRGRRKRDESMSRAGTESAGTGYEKDEEETVTRSVSRGRTGRSVINEDQEVEKSVAELDGLEIASPRIVPKLRNTKGSVGRARQVALARLGGMAREKPLPPLPTHSPPSTPRSSRLPTAHPPRRSSRGWLPRWNAILLSQQHHQSHELNAISPTVKWSDSQTITSSPQQPQPGRLRETTRVFPPELIVDELESPGVHTTALDRYVVPEQYRQALERQQELENWQIQYHRQERERKLRQRRELEAELARHETSDSSGNNPEVPGNKVEQGSEWMGARIQQMTCEVGSTTTDKNEDEGSEVEIDVATLVRGGNGGCGDAQSDENFEESHALDEDAVSLTESLREKKKAESLRKVASWEDGTRAMGAETKEEDADTVVVEKERDCTTEPQNEEANSGASLDDSPAWKHNADLSWEIRDARRRFEKFLDTKTRMTDGALRSESVGKGSPVVAGRENSI